LAAKLEIINISSVFVAGFWKFTEEDIFEANVTGEMLILTTRKAPSSWLLAKNSGTEARVFVVH
jgi:hypothetical protein